VGPRRPLEPRAVACGVVFVLSFGLGFLPLFGGPGYEHALASGLLVPSAAAILSALEMSSGAPRAPIAALARGVTNGALLAAIAFATALLHGALRVGFCDLAGGAIGFFLTAFLGSLLGGAWGAYVAERARAATRRRLAAVLLALSAPLFSIGVSVWRFYASPMIFAFDPFVGYFSGTLYDTVIDAGTPLLTYRLGTAASLAAIAFAASLLERDHAGHLTVARRVPGTIGRAILGALALATSLAITWSGPALGHWQTPQTIMTDLAGKRSGARCDVVFPDTLREDEILLLVKDCDEEVASVEKTLGARGPDRITAFFFRDAADKKRLMGAYDTYIAKPWRREVYLQVAPYPHPVLGHELAHVIAGRFGRGPFRISGGAGGLLPNPGLIEGLAVAASPDDDELTDEAWARAMLDLGILPPIGEIFSLDFLGQSHQKSYTIAGAFIRWLMVVRGADKVRALYAGATIESVTGKSWGALDADFRAHLRELVLPPEAESYAKAKFDRPSVFGRRCPHVIDDLLHQAHARRDAMQCDKAIRLYDEVLRKDPHDFNAMHGRGLTLVRWAGPSEEQRGRAQLEALASDVKTPRTWKDRAEEALADADYLAGDHERAAERYKELARASLDEDGGRMLEVKGMAALDPRARAAVGALLLGTPTRPADPFLGAARLGAWSEATKDPLADYLIGKNLAQHGWYKEASPYLERVLAAGPPTPRIHRETLRQLGAIACALGDRAGVERVRRETRDGASPFRATAGGRAESLDRMLDRCDAR
jgi:tetratricopeptide (TPR) repeat protein